MEQGTKAGTKVSENTRIKIVVSSGKQKEEVTMPDVRGLDQDKAQKELEKLGLKVSVTYEYSSMYAEERLSPRPMSREQKWRKAQKSACR